ncbi:hypothetical protein [uncultured Ruthenibacterium sp.]|uniref:hypothetical protein n=1 Tax=uncultured Ruthenibacterium sp. TaxID=1905347 RepID=UPI00349E7CC0
MRLTTRTVDGYELSVHSNDAVQKLGRLEDLCEELPKQQQQIHQRMDELRNQGKEKSCQFRELMVQKLNNSMLIATLQAHGLMD